MSEKQNDDNKPFVLVLGHPRSGTSLVCNILHKLYGYDFTWNLPSLDEIYDRCLNPDGYFQRQDLHLLCFYTELHKANGPIVRPETKAFVRLQLRTLLSTGARPSATAAVGIKEPYLLWCMEEILAEFPDIHIIMVVRNPAHVNVSSNHFVKVMTRDGTEEHVPDDAWINYMRETVRLRQSGLSFHTILYDALIANPSTYILSTLAYFAKRGIQSIVHDPIVTVSSIVKQLPISNLQLKNNSDFVFASLCVLGWDAVKAAINDCSHGKTLHLGKECCICGSGKTLNKCCGTQEQIQRALST